MDRKSFTEMYTPWDEPSFNPASNYLIPKKTTESSNRSVMARLYESVLGAFNGVRQRQLRAVLEPKATPAYGVADAIPNAMPIPGDPPGTIQVWGSNG